MGIRGRCHVLIFGRASNHSPPAERTCSARRIIQPFRVMLRPVATEISRDIGKFERELPKPRLR